MEALPMSTSSPNFEGQLPADAENLDAVQEIFLRPADMSRDQWLAEHFTQLVLDHMRDKQCDGFRARVISDTIDATVEFKLLSVKKLK